MLQLKSANFIVIIEVMIYLKHVHFFSKRSTCWLNCVWPQTESKWHARSVYIPSIFRWTRCFVREIRCVRDKSRAKKNCANQLDSNNFGSPVPSFSIQEQNFANNTPTLIKNMDQRKWKNAVLNKYYQKEIFSISLNRWDQVSVIRMVMWCDVLERSQRKKTSPSQLFRKAFVAFILRAVFVSVSIFLLIIRFVEWPEHAMRLKCVVFLLYFLYVLVEIIVVMHFKLLIGYARKCFFCFF